MSNFFWTADGNYVKKSIYEHLNNNFSVNDDQFCIQDTCLSKTEMILLKESVTNYNIFQNVNNKDILTTLEIKEYLKEIFRIIHSSTGEERIANINKFLAFGIKDTKTSNIYEFGVKYDDIDFNKLYMAIPDIRIETEDFSEDVTRQILTTNMILDPRDSKKRFIVTNKNITNIAARNHYFAYNGLEFWFVKPKTDVNHWKLIIFWNQLVNDAYINFDTQYKEVYKTNFDNISIINSKETITKIEYMKLLDDLKVVSIKDGLFDYNSFKDNIFIKQYNILLNLDIITKEYFDSIIYESNEFKLSVIQDNDILIELKSRLGVDFIGSKHYILDETETYNIRLLRVKYPNNDNFQWQVLYLENKSFIAYENIITPLNEIQSSEQTNEPLVEQTNEPLVEPSDELINEGFLNFNNKKKPVMDGFFIKFFK